MGFNRDPKTKSDILDRMLQLDFNGDLRTLGQDGKARLERVRGNVLRVTFPNSGDAFELTVHKRREDNPHHRNATKLKDVAEAEPAKESQVQRRAPRRKVG